MIARPIILPPAKLKEKVEKFENVLRKVRELVDDEDVIEKIMQNPIYDKT